MALDPVVIADRITARVNATDTDATDRVQRCADAAISTVSRRTGVPLADLSMDDDSLVLGVELLGERYYTYAGTSALGYSQLGSDIVQGLGFPRDAERDLEHHWSHAVVSWGIA